MSATPKIHHFPLPRNRRDRFRGSTKMVRHRTAERLP